MKFSCPTCLTWLVPICCINWWMMSFTLIKLLKFPYGSVLREARRVTSVHQIVSLSLMRTNTADPHLTFTNDSTAARPPRAPGAKVRLISVSVMATELIKNVFLCVCACLCLHRLHGCLCYSNQMFGMRLTVAETVESSCSSHGSWLNYFFFLKWLWGPSIELSMTDESNLLVWNFRTKYFL